MTIEAQQLHEIGRKVDRMEILQESTAKDIATLVSSMQRLVEKLDKSDDMARDADQRARSAHHRLDELSKQITELRGDVTNSQRWLIGMFISSGALLVAVVGLGFKFLGA